MRSFRRHISNLIPSDRRSLITSAAPAASGAPPRHVRDRGLDHAVERERHLRTVVNIKNLLKSEPTKSLPLSVISQQKDALRIPTRPIEFLRKFPTVFAEFCPGNLPVNPHFKLTDEVLELDGEERLVYQSDSYRREAADRVLRLLMLGRKCEMPLGLVRCLVWDMGLPLDFLETVVPDFPDYFRVVNDRDGSNGGGVLEVVCWSSDLAESVVERKVKGGDSGRVEFDLLFSKGFEMDKKMKKWFDEWQRLPYVSPYESGCCFESTSEEADKWAVGVLHELLHLFIPKKSEKETALLVGEYLGIRSKFKKAMLCHPGIFYVSSKNRTHTVVLKEGFKRGSLVKMHPLMNIRNRYTHLMNTIKEDRKGVSMPGLTGQQRKVSHESKQQAEEVDEMGEGASQNSLSSSEVDDDDTDDESNDEEDWNSHSGGRSSSHNVVLLRGRTSRNAHSLTKGHSRNHAGDKRVIELYTQKIERFSPGVSNRKESSKIRNVHGRLPKRSAIVGKGRSFTE